MITIRRVYAFLKKRWNLVSSDCLRGRTNKQPNCVKGSRAPQLLSEDNLGQQLEHFQELLSYFTSFLTSDLRIGEIKHQVECISEKLNQIDKAISRLNGMDRERLLKQIKKPLEHYLFILCDSVFFNCSLSQDHLQNFMHDLEFIEQHILHFYHKVGAVSLFELKQRIAYFKIYLHQEYYMHNQRKQCREKQSLRDVWLEHQRKLLTCPKLRNSWPLNFLSFHANKNSL